VGDFFADEIAEAMRQIGIRSFDEARELSIRHPGAFDFGDGS
jgi:hypothetical protein